MTKGWSVALALFAGTVSCGGAGAAEHFHPRTLAVGNMDVNGALALEIPLGRARLRDGSTITFWARHALRDDGAGGAWSEFEIPQLRSHLQEDATGHMLWLKPGGEIVRFSHGEPKPGSSIAIHRHGDEVVIQEGTIAYEYRGGALKLIGFGEGAIVKSESDGSDILSLSYLEDPDDWLVRSRWVTPYRRMIEWRGSPAIELVYDETAPLLLRQIVRRGEAAPAIRLSYDRGLLSLVESRRGVVMKPAWKPFERDIFVGSDAAGPVRLASDGEYTYRYFRRDVWLVLGARHERNGETVLELNTRSRRGTMRDPHGSMHDISAQ